MLYRALPLKMANVFCVHTTDYNSAQPDLRGSKLQLLTIHAGQR